MKNLLVSFFVYLVLAVTAAVAARPAWAGKEVDNGAGLSEQNLVFAFENFSALLAPCLVQEACGLTHAETRVLSQVGQPLLGPSKVVQLRFARARELGSAAFSIVDQLWFVNQDLLWQDAARTRPSSLVDGILLLIRIADSRAPALGLQTYEKLRSALSRTVIERRLELTDATIIFRFWNDRSEAQALLDDGSSVDLASTLKSLVSVCESDALVPFHVLDPIARQAESQGSKVALGFLVKAKRDCGSGARKAVFNVVFEIASDANQGERLKLVEAELMGEE